MACEKYSSWMTDAALGALAPGRAPELLTHAAQCDPCREAYQHAQEVAAFVDRGIASLVSGEPSPHFAARLRARIAVQRAPGRFRLPFVAPASSQLFAVVTGVLIFAILLFVVAEHPLLHVNPNQAITAANQIPSPSPQVVAVNPSFQPIAPEPPRASRAHRSIQPATPRSSEPEVLVQPGQFAAVMQFADALNVGSINGEKLLAAQQPLEKPLEVAPIEIPLLDAPKNEGDSAEPADNSGHL
jgi:hypothetical protein